MQLALERLPSYEAELGETLQVSQGDTVKVTVGFEYRGGATTFTLYGALGNRGTLGFDEILNGESPFDVPETATWKYLEKSVTIKITERIDPGFYDLYCKIKEDESVGRPEQIDVVEVKGGIGWKGTILIAGLALAGGTVLAAVVGRRKGGKSKKS